MGGAADAAGSRFVFLLDILDVLGESEINKSEDEPCARSYSPVLQLLLLDRAAIFSSTRCKSRLAAPLQPTARGSTQNGRGERCYLPLTQTVPMLKTR